MASNFDAIVDLSRSRGITVEKIKAMLNHGEPGIDFEKIHFLIVGGHTGTGKTALITAFLCPYMTGSKGRALLANCTAEIQETNKKLGYDHTPPKRPPVFTTEPIWGIEKGKRVQSYWVHGERIGFAENADVVPLDLPPWSVVGIFEAQGPFNARESHKFKPWRSRYFEGSRHHCILRWLFDAQRVDLIDLNIKLLSKIVEVVAKRGICNEVGTVIATVWKLRFYWNDRDYQGNVYTEMDYLFEGDIHKHYDCRSLRYKYPPKGKDYDSLEHLSLSTPAERALYENVYLPHPTAQAIAAESKKRQKKGEVNARI